MANIMFQQRWRNLASTLTLPLSETKTSFAFLIREKFDRKNNAIYKRQNRRLL
jgi:hypothetical protein